MSPRQGVMRSSCKCGQILWSQNDFRWSCILYSLKLLLQALIKNNFFLHFQEFKSFNIILCALNFYKVLEFQVKYLWKRNLREFWSLNWPLECQMIDIHDCSNHISLKSRQYCCFYQIKAPRIQKILMPITPPQNLSLGQLSFKKYQLSLTLALNAGFAWLFRQIFPWL